jgi:hypothetical protein
VENTQRFGIYMGGSSGVWPKGRILMNKFSQHWDEQNLGGSSWWCDGQQALYNRVDMSHMSSGFPVIVNDPGGTNKFSCLNVGDYNAIIASGTAPPLVMLAGRAPGNQDQDLVITITTPGDVGVARFAWSLAGVAQGTNVVTADSVQLTIGNPGLVAWFQPGTYSADNTYTAPTTGSLPITAQAFGI